MTEGTQTNQNIGSGMQTKQPYSIRNQKVTKTDDELLDHAYHIDEPSISVT